MPDGGGLRAAKEMVVVAPAARLIAFSAFDKTLIRRAMTVAGVSAYISKSGDIRELLDAIRVGRDVDAFTPR
jgi:DNA-binding NarL/FixJ family response regulator